MNWLKGASRRLEQGISAWPNVIVRDHRFGGREFLFGKAEIGHVHWGRTVDIPFPRALRDALIADGLCEEHRWVRDSGWTTFHIRTEQDLSHALWLMRLSYLRYALKIASDARQQLDNETEAMRLNCTYRNLLAKFLPVTERARDASRTNETELSNGGR